MEVTICADECTLIRSMENLSLEPPCVISIDGVDGVGKSTLASKIADQLGLLHVEIDTFVREQQGGYIDYIDYDRLGETIERAIVAGKAIIIEGICVQQVLNKLNLNSNTKVYIKVIDNYGFWMDQIRLFPSEKSAEEVLAERKAKRFSRGHMEDIIRYHYTFKPHKNADYIFEKLKT